MGQGKSAGVDIDSETPWARFSGQRGAEPDGKRREATIKADGEESRGRACDGHRGIEVGFGERERLLDPDVLPGPERGTGKFAVFIMSGCDEDR
jgi:hypothetical protein